MGIKAVVRSYKIREVAIILDKRALELSIRKLFLVFRVRDEKRSSVVVDGRVVFVAKDSNYV